MPSFLLVLFLIVSILLIIVVLLQKGRGGGLGAAFGSGSGSAFGTKTGDVLTWVTIVLTAFFLIFCILATVVNRPDVGQVAMPSVDHAAGPILDPIDVSISSNTRGARLYYEVNGGDPTEKSTAYTGSAIKIKPGAVLKVRAFRSGAEPSAVLTAEYPLAKTDTPAFSRVGEIDGKTNVRISCDTPAAAIRYTRDGSEPTVASDVYDALKGVDVEPGMTLRARAWAEKFAVSDIATAIYELKKAESTSAPATSTATAPAATTTEATTTTAPATR
jgi:preprotein translocase subunit SecG